MRPACTSRSVIYLRAPASGTKSSTVCFLSSARTGLVSHEVIVNLISATTTQTGLEVRAKLDTNAYPPGAKVSKKEIAEINIRPDSFHGEWNYTIRPNSAVT